MKAIADVVLMYFLIFHVITRLEIIRKVHLQRFIKVIYYLALYLKLFNYSKEEGSIC